MRLLETWAFISADAFLKAKGMPVSPSGAQQNSSSSLSARQLGGLGATRRDSTWLWASPPCTTLPGHLACMLAPGSLTSLPTGTGGFCCWGRTLLLVPVHHGGSLCRQDLHTEWITIHPAQGAQAATTPGVDHYTPSSGGTGSHCIPGGSLNNTHGTWGPITALLGV